jgi:hypothetical protein
MVSEAGQSLLVGRLSPDRELARNAAFALFVRVYLEQVALLPRRLLATAPTLASLPDAIAEVLDGNPHVCAFFADPGRRQGLAGLDQPAVRELLGWLQAQRVEQEEPQVAYELGLLALGAELPAIMVRGLRQATVGRQSRVAELPDGAGYAIVFLATLHPTWQAATGARLFVSGGDAEQLAGWAMLLLSRTLRLPSGSIVKVGAADALPFSDERFDLVLQYNPVPWLIAPQDYTRALRAAALIVV